MDRRVTFSEPPVTYCYELPPEDRTSPWEVAARDRVRFHNRIRDLERRLLHVFENRIAYTRGLKGEDFRATSPTTKTTTK